MPRESSEATSVRRKYAAIKRLYHEVGEKAAGKPAHSRTKRDYAVVKKEYHRLGRQLGRLTKRRSR